MALQREILVQLFILGLIGAQRDRAVGGMLEPRLKTGIALQRQPERVVNPNDKPFR